ncbi:hypothetical protein F1643_14645 [Azospirillum sp. INR13]|uniref:DUF262 domain-containing protein n=1 Tax=Azospirillum sp. INR13 TaxID=2596919 RepID=UPI00189262B4|nr:DUF262 domain-containing protein [Azospirillum sp. INR13]MBF5095482.1 hypothetical protein [Azospirillum sp. INR13]
MSDGKKSSEGKVVVNDDPDYETPDSFQEEEEDFISNKRFSQPTLYNTDWTAGTAVNQIIRGIIDLNPRFQRRSAWGNVDKSKFIESLAMGIPIPQVIFS